MSHRFPAVALMSLFLAGSAAAQASVRLDRPEAEFPEPFTRVTSIRELPSRRVLVSDVQDKLVLMLDLGTGTATRVGREGQGPGEYALPSTLLPLPNGETWLQDVLGRRYLPIRPDGTVGDPVPLPNLSGGAPGGGMMMFMGGPQVGDARGRLYFQAPPFNPANPDAPSPDSTAILRWDRVKTSFDTVAWIGTGANRVRVSGSGGRREFNFTMGMAKVFEPQEAWGVAGDGAIARVTPEPYRVTWYAGSRSAAAGPIVPWTPIKVTEAEKKEVIEARKRMRPIAVMIGGGGRVAQPPSVQMPDPEFAETKPPFSGNAAVMVAPEGDVWILKNQAAGARNPVYDVFDRTGTLARKVTLNPRSRVVGFGPGTVYVVRSDEDDLEYLQRYGR